MYANSRTYTQKLQSGLDLWYLIDLGGFLQDLQDTWKDLKITKKDSVGVLDRQPTKGSTRSR
jgi:hypothetical protein